MEDNNQDASAPPEVTNTTYTWQDNQAQPSKDKSRYKKLAIIAGAALAFFGLAVILAFI